jgi:trehalose 6-phosphate phosphatase
MPGDMLSRRNFPILSAFAASNVLLAFDYDGTLAPIVSHPSRAHMRAATARLLAEVAQRYPCVVISGRELDDLTTRLEGIPVWYVFGNHGLEPSEPQTSTEDATIVRDWVQHLNATLSTQAGVTIEEKRYSLTIHYRHARDKAKAIAAISAAAAGLPQARAVGGTLAVSLIPRDGHNKGTALQRARRRFACDTAIYVGDDDTDEDAFRSGGREHLLSVRVRRSRTTAARFYLARQSAIDEFLRTLVALRDVRTAMQAGRRDR